MTKRILGIDYGRRRLGVAISDSLGFTAQMLKTLDCVSIDDALTKLADIIATNEIGAIVIGLPRNMNGTDSSMTREVRGFAERLKEKVNLPVHFVDERLSSSAALKTMQQTGEKIRNNKGKIDRIAAALLLQTHLDSQSSLARNSTMAGSRPRGDKSGSTDRAKIPSNDAD